MKFVEVPGSRAIAHTNLRLISSRANVPAAVQTQPAILPGYPQITFCSRTVKPALFVDAKGEFVV
jgi:hypothetical protein